jgi:hypothetical protein
MLHCSGLLFVLVFMLLVWWPVGWTSCFPLSLVINTQRKNGTRMCKKPLTLLCLRVFMSIFCGIYTMNVHLCI